MSTAILENPAIEAAAQETALDDCIDKLGELRFLVILTARWEGSDSLPRDRRQKLRSDLMSLRRQYSCKIDEIAMSFGVQEAMDAKERVERTVTVPRGVKPPEPLEDLELG